MDIDLIIKNPCKHCKNKQIDSYGYVCDLTCGEYSAYLSQIEGAKKVLEYLKERYGKP